MFVFFFVYSSIILNRPHNVTTAVAKLVVLKTCFASMDFKRITDSVYRLVPLLYVKKTKYNRFVAGGVFYFRFLCFLTQM